MTFLLTLFPCPIVVLKKSFEFKSRKELVTLKLKKNNNLQPVLASNYIFFNQGGYFWKWLHFYGIKSIHTDLHKKSICLSLIPIKLYSNDVDESFRLIVKEGDSSIADSGTLYDVSIPGGRIGVFAYNQTGVIWSDMRFECKDRWVVFLFLCIIIEIFKGLV